MLPLPLFLSSPLDKFSFELCNGSSDFLVLIQVQLQSGTILREIIKVFKSFFQGITSFKVWVIFNFILLLCNKYSDSWFGLIKASIFIGIINLLSFLSHFLSLSGGDRNVNWYLSRTLIELISKHVLPNQCFLFIKICLLLPDGPWFPLFHNFVNKLTFPNSWILVTPFVVIMLGIGSVGEGKQCCIQSRLIRFLRLRLGLRFRWGFLLALTVMLVLSVQDLLNFISMVIAELLQLNWSLSFPFTYDPFHDLTGSPSGVSLL